MSSMMKKKFGLAFKPKAPPPRRGAPASTPTPTQAAERSATADSQPSSGAPPPSTVGQDGPVSTSSQTPSPAVVPALDGPTQPGQTPGPPQTAPQASTTTTRSAQSKRDSALAASNDSQSAEATAGPLIVGVEKRKAPAEREIGASQTVEPPQKRQKKDTTVSLPDGPDGREDDATHLAEQHLEQPDNAAPTSERREAGRKATGKGASTTGKSAAQAGKGDGTAIAAPTAGKRAQQKKGAAAGASSATALPGGELNSHVATQAAAPLEHAGQGTPEQQAAVEQPGASNVPPKKARKPSAKAPPSAAVNDGAEASGQQETGATAAPKKRRQTKKKADNSGQTADGPGPTEQGIADGSRPKQRPSKKRASPADQGEDGQQAGEEVEVRPKKKRRERSVTPEDAETQTVDHRELRMEDLTRDLRIGKKFSKHDELLNRIREKRANYRQGRKSSKQVDGQGSDGESQLGGHEQTPGPSTGGTQSGTPAPTAETLAGKAPLISGPQFEIVDGNIVVNQASLVHDRHAVAAAEAGELEEVEENDFTRETTSNTYLKPGKLRGPNAWSDDDTEQFYKYLNMFGTDFTIISKLFPGRSRRHIKMKFNREEKFAPDRITRALVGEKSVAIDIEEYASRTGQTLLSTEAIDAEYEHRQAEHDAEQRRIADEAAEALQRKRDELFGHHNSSVAQDGQDHAAGSASPATAAATANNGDKLDRDKGRKNNTARIEKTTVTPDGIEEIDETEEAEAAAAAAPRGRGRGRGRGKAKHPVAGGFGV